jgi:type I restriction enzyme S subunit
MEELTGRKPRFYKGDIVYGYLRPYLNKVWIAEFDGLCSVDQYIYAVNSRLADTRFVAWFMRSPVYLERAPIDTTPGQLPRIRTEEVAAVEINLPSLPEQQRIAAELTEQMAAVEQLRAALAAQLATITALPATLLRRAFNGEL